MNDDVTIYDRQVLVVPYTYALWHAGTGFWYTQDVTVGRDIVYEIYGEKTTMKKGESMFAAAHRTREFLLMMVRKRKLDAI
jgi:hypothetical protein